MSSLGTGDDADGVLLVASSSREDLRAAESLYRPLRFNMLDNLTLGVLECTQKSPYFP